MGRMWEALRRGGGSASDDEGSRARLSPVEDAEPMLAAVEEIPFIEVGPHKSMEASPSVLACKPVAVPERRSVPFRTVYLAAAETQPETPQSDGPAQSIISK